MDTFTISATYKDFKKSEHQAGSMREELMQRFDVAQFYSYIGNGSNVKYRKAAQYVVNGNVTVTVYQHW